MRYCIYCGMPMDDDDKFCTRCGKSQGEEQASRNPADGDSRANKWMTPSQPPVSTSQWKYTAPHNTQYQKGFGTKDESGINTARIAIITAACLLVAAVGVVLFIKLRPARDDSADSGDNSYAYYSQDTDSGESYDQGQQMPSSGQVDSNTPAATGAGGSSEVSVQSGQDQEVQVTSEDDDAETGWVIDEDGNEIYYPSEGEEYTGNDQTGNEVEEYTGNDQTGDEVQEEEEAVAIQSDPEPAELSGNTQAGDNSYILSESSSRYYSQEELSGLSDYDLQMAINEIYARHGRKFDTKSIREYFEKKSWYNGTISPADFDKNEDSYFNKYEKANKDLMAKIRAEREKASGKTINWE